MARNPLGELFLFCMLKLAGEELECFLPIKGSCGVDLQCNCRFSIRFGFMMITYSKLSNFFSFNFF